MNKLAQNGYILKVYDDNKFNEYLEAQKTISYLHDTHPLYTIKWPDSSRKHVRPHSIQSKRAPSPEAA